MTLSPYPKQSPGKEDEEDFCDCCCPGKDECECHCTCECHHTLPIISSEFHNKAWRHKNISSNQRDGKCEKQQRQWTEDITKKPCSKSNGLRINTETAKLEEKRNCLASNGNAIPNGFEYTEDFDGIQTQGKDLWLYNFKFVGSGGGGAQTRTLGLVYHFVRAQLALLLKKNMSPNYRNVYFLNILDGDVSFKRMTHYKYLLNQEQYRDVKQYCFVGDTLEFRKWYKGHFGD